MTDVQDKILAQLAALRKRYAADLPAKIQQIRTGFEALNKQWDRESVSTLHRQAHSLTGSGATFGYAEVSQAARNLEQRLKALMETENLTALNDWSGWDQQLGTLEMASLVAVPASETPTPKLRQSARAEQRLLFVVDDDTDLSREQRLQYELHGYKVREFHQFDELEQAIRSESPLAIVMDIMFPEGDLAGIRNIARLRAALGKLPPVVFASDRKSVV